MFLATWLRTQALFTGGYYMHASYDTSAYLNISFITETEQKQCIIYQDVRRKKNKKNSTAQL